MNIGIKREIRISSELVVQLAELAGLQLEQSSLEQLTGALETQIQFIQSMPFGDPLQPVSDISFDPRWDR